MRKYILSLGLAIGLTGCANTHKGRAMQLVIISDGVADETANLWDVFVEAQINHCKTTLGEDATKEEGEECLGLAADGREPLEAAVQSLVAVQVAIKEAVKCEELKSCPQEIDWKELKEEVLNAWGELKPFYDAIGGRK